METLIFYLMLGLYFAGGWSEAEGKKTRWYMFVALVFIGPWLMAWDAGRVCAKGKEGR